MKQDTLRLVRAAPSTVKVALTYIISASLVLTAYYFARGWAYENKDRSMLIRQNLNDEFSIERLREKQKSEGSSKD